jgi:membrane-associated phospholipid phosphatase
MIIKSSSAKVKPFFRKLNLMIFFFMLALFYTFDFIYKHQLWEESLTIIPELQKAPESILHFMKFMSNFAAQGTFLVTVIIINNYFNIYKSIILLMIYLICTFLTTLFRLIYADPRPYFLNEAYIRSYGCEVGFGNPSAHIEMSMSCYLTIWRILCDCRVVRLRKWIKWVLLVFFLLLISLIMVSKLFMGSNSLDQILYGASLGFLLYYFFFYCIDLNLNDPKQFTRFIEIKNLYYLVFNIMILGVFIFIVQYVPYGPQEQYIRWSNTINERCKGIMDEIPHNLRFQYECFIMFAVFFSNIGAFIALKLELHITFKGDLQNWVLYNFSNLNMDEDNSLLSTLSKDTQWNQTRFFKSSIRLVLSILICLVFMTPYLLVDFSANIFVIFFVKLFIPFTLILFFTYYACKPLFRKLKLVNTSMFMFEEN